MGRRLSFEIVPSGCWHYNLRAILSKSQWDYIKKYTKDKAHGKCMICGKSTNKPEAHEIWEYDEKNGIIKLKDVISICKDCHQSIHIERSHIIGVGEKAEDNYIKVNGITYAEMRQDLKKANEINELREKVSEWRMDISRLKTLFDEGD